MPRFIEPLEPPVATPLLVCFCFVLQYTKLTLVHIVIDRSVSN